MSESMREFYESYIWDAYKDVNGIRPRFADFESFSDDELERWATALESEISQEYAAARAHEELVLFAMAHPHGFVWFNDEYVEQEYDGSVERAIAAHDFSYLEAYIQSEVHF